MSRVYVDLFEKWSCWVADSTTPPQGWRSIVVRVGDDNSKTWHQAELTVPEAEAVARELMRMVQNARTAPTQTLAIPLPAPAVPINPDPAPAPPPPRRKRELTEEQRKELAERLRRGREAAQAARAALAAPAERGGG
jgi:hypothetical protein